MKNDKPTPWTGSETVRLRELWANPELSCAEMGAQLGRSKNSVIGQAHRLGLPKRARQPTLLPKFLPHRSGSGGGVMAKAAPLSKPPQPVRLSSLKLPKRATINRIVAAAQEIREKVAKKEFPSFPKTLEEIGKGECRFILPDMSRGGEKLYCADPTVSGVPWYVCYCEKHLKIVYHPGALERLREKERQLRARAA
jgi:hypothetical protein